jgi:hypothetical protein
MAHVTTGDAIDRRLDALAREPFRAKFRLAGRERGWFSYVAASGGTASRRGTS